MLTYHVDVEGNPDSLNVTINALTNLTGIDLAELFTPNEED